MLLKELLTLDSIEMKTDLTTKNQVMQKIASVAVTCGLAVSEEMIVEGLEQREEESTTGFFDGFAIPHTKQTEIIKPGVIIVVNKNGIDWNALDGKPATFFIALLIPANEAGTTHLNVLAAFSRMLMQEEVRYALLQAENSETVYDLVTRFLKENMDK